MNAVVRKDETTIDELVASYQRGYSLEQRFYTDADIYERELERVVHRTWIMAGHVSEFAEAGDFKVFNVGGESAIIVRGSAGELKAFANVCRHRGSLVCLDHEGTTDKFTCPYHGWMYDIDGNLTAARAMPDGFDKSSHSLNPVSLAEVHGLVFISFTDNPPSLDGAIKDLEEPMAMFDFANLKVAARRDYDIPANWKLSVENYTECYHCAPSHPEYAAMHTLMLDDDKKARVQQHMEERMESCGLRNIDIDYVDIKARPGELGYGYSRTALFKKYLTGSRDGKPVAPLLGELTDYDGGASDFSLGPLSYLLAYSDHVVSYVFTPIDHHSSRCEITWFVRGDAEEGKDYDVDELVWLWDITTHADKEIIVNNSKGVHSRYYKPGPLSDMEDLQQDFIDWYIREMQRA